METQFFSTGMAGWLKELQLSQCKKYESTALELALTLQDQIRTKVNDGTPIVLV